MLKIENFKIVDKSSKEVKLRGVNLGGWLMMEGYILGGKNIPEHVFKTELAHLYGPKFVPECIKNFRGSFITPADFKQIKKLGFNCIRLPFNYRLIEEPNGIEFLKMAVMECAKNKLFVILDMHAVPGAQSLDWHADCAGKALFWEEKKFQKQFLNLWGELARTFKNEEWVAGYDIMNEPVTENVRLLQEVYQKTVDTIRQAGDQHIIFLEGNHFGRHIDFIKNIKGENIALSVHFYEPLQFTFNWLPDAVYPGKIMGKNWNKNVIKKILADYAKFADELGKPILVGEFGVASRCAYGGEEFGWVEDVVQIFNEFGFHWTYWTYKAVRGLPYPDGLYQLSDPSGIIGDKCKASGMENFYDILKTRKKEFFNIWNTKNFKLHQRLYSILKR